MTKAEKEILTEICDDIGSADDKIDGLERLYSEVKKMVYSYERVNAKNRV